MVGRIRVLIAGNIYVKRALVSRFLEDDGYEVVGEATTGEELLPAIRLGRPDAIVVDDELVPGETLGRIRREAPDAKVVVFTSATPGEGWVPPGADGYLEKGVGLAALTATLGRLFSELGSLHEPALVGAGVGAGAGADDSISDTAIASRAGMVQSSGRMTKGTLRARRDGDRGVAVRLTTLAGGAILVVWGMIAMITTIGTDTATRPVDRTDQSDGGTVIAQPEQTALDAAYRSMDAMIAAIEGGNYVLATVQAQSFIDDRAQALAQGFSISGLDAEVTTRLQAVVSGIPASVSGDLQQILGGLYPVLEDESEPGGGSDVVLGGTPLTNTGGTSGGDTTTGGNGGGGNNGGGDGGGGGGGGGGDGFTFGPGDGRAWGLSHKRDHVPGSGPPPWARGKALGLDQAKHAKGK